MNRFVALCSKLKYLGLLGLPMLFSDAVIWKYLWLFWLFGFVEIAASFTIILQSLKQLVGLPYILISHGFHLPGYEDYKPKVEYSLPFNGPWTVVNGGPDNETSHSWGVYTQRYAYDFIILDDSGQSSTGDKTLVENYYCYGKEVLAPADGIVADVKDLSKDARTFGNGKVDPDVKSICGNHIVIKHAEGEYSLIAHLKPQSVRVKPGESVKRGQVIALCGNSGNTSEPHIHFHIQDGKSFYASAGLPIHFKNIATEKTTNYDKLDPRPVPDYAHLDGTRVHRGLTVSNRNLP